MSDQENDIEKEEGGLAGRVSALGQKIIGEIETFGGILTGDPITQAEGEYNVEVVYVRQDLEEELEEEDSNRRDAETPR